MKRNELFDQLRQVISKVDAPAQEKNHFLYRMTIRFFPEFSANHQKSEGLNGIFKAIA